MSDVFATPRLAALSLLVSSVAQAAMTAGVVDLNNPAELQSLRDSRPEHYAKARAILALAESRPNARVGRWIETRFGASDVELLQWRVSDPPKLRVSFTLDGTRYSAELVPSLEPVRAMPALRPDP